jgi:hypothetical protein
MKKRTLLQWLSDKEVGKSSPRYAWTLRERIMLEMLSKYLQYLHKEDS